MDDYLRSVRSALGAGGFEAGCSVHIVLGGPEVDVDTVASTLSLALHLSQNDPEGSSFCVPVLLGGGGGDGGVEVLPEETVEFLQRVEVSESSLVWRRDVDLMELHRVGSLSLTLMSDDALDGSERSMLASSVVRVVHRRRQQDAWQEEEASSAATIVAREILQEAAEHVRGVLGEVLGEALRLQKERLFVKNGRHSARLEELVQSLGKCCEVTAVQHRNNDSKRHDKDIEQQLTQMLTEFTDGEITLALTSMIADPQDWYGYLNDFKAFCHRHNYDSLVVVKYAVQSLHPMVAVYSDSTEILNQICCELEESSFCSQSGMLESEEFIRGCLQVYHLSEDVFTSASKAAELEEGLRGHLKAFIERRSFVLACHPSSRTSSTEGVAGSVGFSQGSSGITDMYGSDTERTCTDEVSMAGETAHREADSGIAGVVGGGGDLVSPDSGMATIRSSRSSKESSVFLSDDSPIGEMMTGAMAPAGPGGLLFRNPSPLGFSSLATPVPPERRKQRPSRNKSDTLELFHFDPLQNIDTSLPAEASLEHLGGNGAASRAVSSSLSEFEELSLVDFYAPKFVSASENAPSIAKQTKPYCGDTLDTEVPPTLVNSLLGSCQEQINCSERFEEGNDEGFTGLQPKQSLTSSLSAVWEEYGLKSTAEQTIDDDHISHVNNVGEFDENILEANQVKGSSMGLIPNYQVDKILKPQLSLITDAESTLNMDSGFTQSLGTSTLADLQLTPPVEDIDGMIWSSFAGVQELSSVARKRQRPRTLTPESSREDDDGIHRRKGDGLAELQDFWSYSAEKGFIKSDSRATTSYPESLDMWNTTIRDDSISPLTTPDIENLPELSNSNRGRAEGGVLIESPLGYSECGMVMWNTTILEDSSSSVTSPDGPESGKDSGLSHDITRCVPGIHMNQDKDQKNADQEKHTNTLAAEEGVKIIVEEVGGRENVQGSHTWSDLAEHDMKAGDHKNTTSSHQILDHWAIPDPKMVISMSEYDNLGASTWTAPSSPETHTCPGTHIIQLDGESSPFIAMLKPKESVDGQSAQCHQHSCSESEENQSQVFLFQELNELDCTGSAVQSESLHKGKDCLKMMPTGLDCEDQPTLHSPFILLNNSPLGNSSASFNVVSLDKDNRENLPTIAEISKSAFNSDLSLDWKTTVVRVDDVPVTEGNCDPHVETRKYVEGAVVDTMSLSPISGGEKDALRCSHDSLLLSSRDELRSNSDGDSSSGLEMDSIVVSGSVTESKGAWSNGMSRAWQSGSSNQVGDTERSMETFSMLSCAATLLKAQESRKQSRQKQMITENNNVGSSVCENQVMETGHARPSHSDHSNVVLFDTIPHDKHTTKQASSKEGTCFVERDAELTTDICSSTQYFTTKHCPIITNTREDSIVLEMTGANITKTPPEVVVDQDALASCCSLLHAAEGNSDGQSNMVVRSMSSSLRHPSDHFLKTREEVYVHSQISMEDSDDGMQSPLASPYCSSLLGGVLGWKDQPTAKDMPQTSPEQPSPELTHSSFSHNSSYIGTPVSESGPLAERARVGSPFGGDLMEDVYHEKDGEDLSLEPTVSTSQNKGMGMEREGDIEMPCIGLMEGECTAQPVDVQTMKSTRGVISQSSEDSPPEQPTALLHLKLSANTEIGDGSSYPPSRRCTDVTSQAFALLPCWNNVYQWTRSHNDHFTDHSTDKQSNRHGDPGAHVAGQQETTNGLVEAGCEPRELLHPPAPDHQGEGQHETEGHSHFIPTGSYEQEDYAASILKTGKERNSQDDEVDDQDVGTEAAAQEAIPEYSAAEERRDSALWRSVMIGEQEHRVDMKCIEPYRRVVSHGGYYGEQNAIIVFAACFLPDSNCENYNHVMENLFLYVISTLELMVAEDYMIVYLNGATPRRKMPGLSWMKKCYQMIDRRLKKNLKLFIIVHPSWFIRTVLGLTRPFISYKFSSKIKYVHSLAELWEMVPMEYVQIPASIVRLDKELQ